MKEKLNELALFAGAGGGILGGHLLGWRTICAVEWEPYPASVLISRQNDGILPPFPVWDDVQTFDGKQWRGRVDVISGGFPCQDISCAGKGAGIDGERSSMWGHMARIIGEVRPRKVLVENSPMLVGRGLARVLGDLAKMGYDAEWCVLGAVDAGAPHKRDRIWIVGESKRHGRQSSDGGESLPNEQRNGQGEKRGRQHESARIDRASESSGEMGNTNNNGLPAPEVRESTAAGSHGSPSGEKQAGQSTGSGEQHEELADSTSIRQQGQGEHERPIHQEEDQDRKADRFIYSSEAGRPWWITEPNVGRVAHGVAARLDRLKAIGNGQVPAVAELAWNTIHNI